MFKLAFTAVLAIAVLTARDAAAADTVNFVIFKNNTTEDWQLQSQSMTGGTFTSVFPNNLVNPPGGLKSELYRAPPRSPTSYTSVWKLIGDATICTFTASARLNAFGNMQFTVAGVASGPRAAQVSCNTVPVGSNLDGSYDFNHSVSFKSYSTYLGFTGNDTATAIVADAGSSAPGSIGSSTYVTGLTDACGPTPAVYAAKLSSTGVLQYFACLFVAPASRSIAVDSAGNAYIVAGSFLAKVNPSGSAFIYSITLSPWTLTGVAADAVGNAYVVGSLDVGGNNDVVVAKLNPSGTAFVYAVSFGGSSDDVGNGIAIDSSGNAYLTGNTQSPDFPVFNAIQPVLRGPSDAFVTKLDSTGSSLFYSTYLGGDTLDAGNGIAVDATRNAYIVGTTAAQNGVQSFPVTTGAAQTAQGGNGDAFVARLNPNAALGYATYLGGSGDDQGAAIAVDVAGSAFVTGLTQSSNFPVRGGGQPGPQSVPPLSDAYITRLDPNGNELKYSGYLGGNSTDTGSSISVDPSRRAYVAGTTASTNFPTTLSPFGGGQDAFITKF